MKNVKVLPGQCLIDLAVQHTGDATRVMELAQSNGISVTDILQPGTGYNVPDEDGSKRSLLQLFKIKANAPASEVLIDVTANPGGIGYWFIEYDFIVT